MNTNFLTLIQKDVSSMDKNNLKILIFHPFANEEIDHPSMGGTRLIYEIKNNLKNEGHHITMMPLSEITSFTSIMHKLVYQIRKNKKKETFLKNESRRWFLNLIYSLITEISSSLDVLYIIKLKKILKKIKPSLIIYNYPYFGLSKLISISKSCSIPIIIYEHNAEYIFFNDKLKNSFIFKILLNLSKKIEINNLKRADYIFTVNKKDKKFFIKEGVSENKINMWIPLPTKIKINKNRIPIQLKNRLNNKFKVGFVGTNFQPNIVCVKNILKIAKKMPLNVVFIILGSVCNFFKNKKDIPKNIFFLGYVEDLDSYLNFCDLFINPKTTSDTGIEIKMIDYLKFKKPIISTKIGAGGFENIKGIIISDIGGMSKKIRLLLMEGNKNGKISKK